MKRPTTWWLPTALILICCGALLSAPACTPSPKTHATLPGAFVTLWKGAKGKPLKIPIVGNYTVTWYEATNPQERHTDTVSIAPESDFSFKHPYVFTPPRDGEYVVEVGPEGVEYMRMGVRDSVDFLFGSRYALLRVLQFGKVRWKSMKGMFAWCKSMTFADTIDTPDLSEVRDMQGMFCGCRAFNSPLEHWDVSQVTDMNSLFTRCESFNQPLEGWNVSQVKNMGDMFAGCVAFNQPLERWDV